MTHACTQLRIWILAVLCLVVLAWTGVAIAQLPSPNAASQFNIDGFLQEATLDPTCAASPLCGGTMKVNGHIITVPKNTIVILPANAMTWQELFACAPPPWGNGYNSPLSPLKCGALVATPQTGLALADCAVPLVAGACSAPPLTTYEVTVTGNKAPGSLGAADTYIAGLINIAQQGLNSGQGYITNIIYPTAGAATPVAELQILNPDGTNTRVRINDPATVPGLSGGVPNGTFTGRYSVGISPDPRFTVDQDNPTIASVTGFPMCIPRTDPAVTPDDLCPQGNRPLDLGGNFSGTFTTPNPLTQPSGSFPDARVQAPFEIGDFITFAGTLVKDCPATGCVLPDGPTVGPWPALGTAATYISAHTIENNIAIYTFPGVNPAYISTNTFILGLGGAPIPGVVEVAKRTRFEGMMTDPSRMVHLYGMDLPCASTTIGGCDRDWGIIGVDQGPPTGAVKGRWRFRPPCAPFGTSPSTIKFDKECIMNAANTFLPATREMRSVIEPLPGSGGIPGWVVGQTTTFANGIIAGQYHAPILDYLFAEQIPGNPVPAADFQNVPFLALGGYTSSLGTLATGPLSPWPGDSQPCTGATAKATANPATAINPPAGTTGALVTLDATGSSGTAPLSYLWTQSAADAVQVLPAGGVASATATFNVPSVDPALLPLTLNFTVAVSNCGGTASSSASTTFTIVGTPIVNHVPPVTVVSGQSGTINISGVDPNGLPLTFAATQTGAPALSPFNVNNPNPLGTTATITFTAPGLPLGTVTPDVITLSITASDGQSVSPAEITSVTVNPQPDIVLVQTAAYRISQKRLTINATDTVISPNIVLTLQPYLTTAGTIFDPCSLGPGGCTFLNQGTGIYLLDIVGAAEPAVPPATPMSIKSNIPGGGTVSNFGLTSIR